MNRPILKSTVITAVCGILSILLGFAVLFAELCGTVFSDKEMPMVVAINAGLMSLVCFLSFLISVCIFRPGIRLVMWCSVIWVIIAGVVLWLEQRP
jgi:uncharacterized membrane protein (GlpM family)